jgi:hypothetical protein
MVDSRKMFFAPKSMADPGPEVAERIEARLDRDGDCWTWTGHVNDKGYGTIRVANRSQYVHRLMFARYNRPLKTGESVDHTCCNKRCCNPAHLDACSVEENAIRRHQRNGETGNGEVPF